MNSHENLFSGHEIKPLRLEAGGRDLKTDSRFPRMNFPPTFSSGEEESSRASAGVTHFLSFQLLPSQTASQTPSRKVFFTDNHRRSEVLTEGSALRGVHRGSDHFTCVHFTVTDFHIYTLNKLSIINANIQLLSVQLLYRRTVL